MSPADDLDTLQLGPDPDKLERYHRQQLSAMLDGELSQDQARFLRRRLQHDGELSACFERWQVCGDVLRGRHVSLLPQEFAARVAAGIANDGVAAPAAAVTRPRALRWGGGGVALVASVALMALFVGRPDPAADMPDAVPARPVADVAAVESSVTDAMADASTVRVGAESSLVSDVPRRTDGANAVRRQPSEVAAFATATPHVEIASTAALAQSRPAAGSTDATDPATPRVVASLSPDSSGAGAATRPWPKASPLSGGSSFSVRYGDGFAAPSWSELDAPASAVLPRFPVDPADVSSSEPARVLR